MKVAIIDADLIARTNHRFPNLACMKLSAYHKERGDDVVLKTDYTWLFVYDLVYISKVFTKTEVPEEALALPNVKYGGTGFFYDKAPKLPEEIEHQFPDYHLYDEWVQRKLDVGEKKVNLKYYTDYSIGFLTRGCFRHCSFCVNQNYNNVEKHSPLSEFYDSTRKKICLLDDNFFGCPDWKEMLAELKATGKPFQFKQGLDERLLTEEKCKDLFSSKYDGDYIFAFDNIEDREIIERKLSLIRQVTNKRIKFYCFCGFDRDEKYDEAFWKKDIIDLLERIKILFEYNCYPYVMRHENYEKSPYRTGYIAIASWANQPHIIKKKTLGEYAEMERGHKRGDYVKVLDKAIPEVKQYLNMRFKEAGNEGKNPATD